MVERIALLGTGLIGGSLGLALRRSDASLSIFGHDRPDVLDTALQRGAITDRVADPVTAVEEAEVVVFATPLGTTLRLMEQVAPHLAPGVVVTDVASVKQPVLDQASDVLPDTVAFVGGHPMAGAEHSGIEHADPLLFENAVYALCLPEDVSPGALEDSLAPVVALVDAVGGRPLVLDAMQHDRVAALVSHLPQLLAVALVNTLSEAEDPETALDLAAGGFRDMTRIATSPFDMWRDVLVGNEGAIHDALSQFSRTLQRVRNRLLSDDFDALSSMFEAASDTRSRIPRGVKGFLQPLADVYVQAPDEPGILTHFTGVLADDGLNIKDLELQKFREGIGSTFRLGFENQADAERAASLLDDAGYEAQRP
jgi:prephenate dehydrogenase